MIMPEVSHFSIFFCINNHFFLVFGNNHLCNYISQWKSINQTFCQAIQKAKIENKSFFFF